jgi:phosphohistidine phosphatase
MKKIILVRHGKAEEAASGISDFERSLTLKGKIISRLMARKLRETEKDHIVFVTSPAFRALETALVFAAEFGIEAEKIIISSILYYKMSPRYLPEILSKVGDQNETVIMFGHNPSFSEIAASLCNEGCEFMSKSGVVGISFEATSWNDLHLQKGRLEYDLKPERVL